MLPGTTLKGALRAVVEAITASCLTVRGQATRLLPPPLHPLRPCTRRDALCPACRLFGGQGYLGRIRLADAPLVTGETIIARVPERHAPRPRPGRPAARPPLLWPWPPGDRHLARRGLRPGLRARLAPRFRQPAARRAGTAADGARPGRTAIATEARRLQARLLWLVGFSVTTLTLDDVAARWLAYAPASTAEPATNSDLDESSVAVPHDDGADQSPEDPDASADDLATASLPPASTAQASAPPATSPPVATGPDVATYLQAAAESGLVLPERLDRSGHPALPQWARLPRRRVLTAWTHNTGGWSRQWPTISPRAARTRS